jgi:uncharacterized protein with beta-barrel porin domain
MPRFARITNLKCGLMPQCAASAVAMAFWLSLSTGHANGGPGCPGAPTPNGNGGIDYVISAAETSTCTITSNDTLTVTGTGSVITGPAGGNAVVSTNNATSVVNQGLISASEELMSGFVNTGTLGSFFNTGTVQGVSTPDPDVGQIVTDAFTNHGVIGLLNNNGGLITSPGHAIFNDGTIVILDNSGGTIRSINGEDKAIDNDGTIGLLNNTGGLIWADDDDAISTDGTIGLINNTNGVIHSGTGSGIELNGLVTSGQIINTGGTISAGSSDNSSLYIGVNAGNLTVIGGTIINTTATDNDGRAVRIDHTQTGLIAFQGVTIVSHGTGVNQGFAILMDAGGGGNVVVSLDSETVVRGRIANGDGDNVFLTTSAAIAGDISLAGGNDVLTINGGSVTGNIFTLGGEDTFTINGGVVTGNLETADSDDTVVFNGGVFNGNINLGAGDHLFTFNGGTLNGNVLTGKGDDVFTYTGGVVNGDIDFGGGLNTLNVDAMWAPTGALTTTNGTTNLNIGHTGHLILDNPVDLGPAQIVVMEDGTLHLRGGDLTGAIFQNHGTTRIGVDRTLTLGVFENSPQGTLIFDTRGVNHVMKTGLIDAFESHSDLSNQIVQVNYLGGTLTLPNHSLIMAGGNTAVLPSAPVTDNSFFYNFGVQVDPGNPNNIFLVLTEVKTIEEVSSSPLNTKTANVLLNELEGSSDPVIQQIQQKLHTASNAQEFNQIIESTQQTVDQGNQVAAVGMTGAMFDLADGQLAMVNTGGGTGVAGGNELQGLHFWTQGFGGWADQGFREGAPGYEASVRGVALGVDTRNFREDTVVGLSIGFANTDVESDNANNTRTEVESYQLMAYGNHELGGDIFLTGMALYGWNDNDQRRFAVGGIPGLTASADYESWVGGMRSSIGRNYHFGPNDGRANAFMLTPQLFSEYVHFSRDGYTETGAGGAGIIAGDASQTIWNLGVSLQAEWTFVTENGGKLKPDVHASYKYDLMDEAADTTSTFIAGGSTIGVEGVDPANSVFGVGAGVKFFDTSGWDFTAAYDFTFKDEYEAHSAFVRAAYEF